MDKSISIDLGDPRTGLVAEALSNKTCVKILDLLSNEELTASDISSKLGIPLNTTGYNLEKLIKAGLVEKSSNFFWSVKGKKTPVYKVANKKIVISPKRMFSKVLPFFLVAGVLAILSISLFIDNDSNQNLYSGSGELEQFDSFEELNEYIQKSISSQTNSYGLFGRTDTQESAVSSDSGAPSEAGTKSSIGTGTGGSSDYSTTNIQVVGVDEADIVKNDGKYIYTINQNKVIIVEAYPADSMKIIGDLEFDNYVNGIFLSEGKLVVIESSYSYSIYGDAELVTTEKVADTIRAPESYRNEVRIHVYDVSDLESEAKKVETFVIDGSYHTARLIDGYVYVIANKYIDYSGPIVPYFKVGDNVESVAADRIYHPGYYDSNLIFTSVMAIDLDSLEYKGDVFLLGSSSTIYVSDNAIYLTSSKTYDYSKVQEGSLGVILEVLPGSYNSRAEEVLDSNDEYYIKSERIALIVQEYFNSLSKDEKLQFEKRLIEVNEKYYEGVAKEYEKTIIHRIDVDGLDIDYTASGEVPGYVLNQFSLDEYDRNFRVATSSGNSFGNFQNTFNNLYILNKDLEIIGSVEGLAQGERIYSARFIGDKAYMVTFRQVDPLYVIDLSNPRSPEVLGWLKVTGFSNYLHPIGDDLLLGIGREADDSGRGQGLKISLFDVSDFANPTELDKYVVESEWSYSEAEYEHKAVLFDDERDLLVIPVTYSETIGNNWQYWQGAFAFTITDKDVSLKGKIAHDLKKESKTEMDREYYNSQGYVSRSLFMDDSLYTISNLMIKANAISDLSDINYVELPNEEQVYYAY
ncbi:helix-turn-helix domain-containing protein [Candidatus Pacearchaeota archaeon]|nr:helix-turn-helix domain-containing protein [Candidatus Pacearchaeota archaeon]